MAKVKPRKTAWELITTDSNGPNADPNSRLNYMHCKHKTNRHPEKTTAGTTHSHPEPRGPPPTPRQPRPNQDTTPQSTKAELEPSPTNLPTAKAAR